MSRNVNLLIQLTLAKIVAKWRMLVNVNCQSKKTIVVFFIYPEFLSCQVFFFGGGGLVIVYILIFDCSHNCAVPHNCRFSPHNWPPKTRTIFFFFPHPVRRPDLCISKSLDNSLFALKQKYQKSVCVKVCKL